MSIDTLKASLGMDEFEVIKSGNANMPNLTVTGSAGQYSSGEGITTIAHNLGFTPAYIINVEVIAGTQTKNYILPYTENNVSAGLGFWLAHQAYTDQNNLYLLTDIMSFGGTTTSVNYKCQYYLLQEKIKRLV